jgi:hypothetical protein
MSLSAFILYEPLHDMRRALESIAPPHSESITSQDRDRVSSEIQDAFNAIREHFLDEFEIEEPSHPIVIRHMKRMRANGASQAARKLHRQQEVHSKGVASS